jgi:hypothetical protein
MNRSLKKNKKKMSEQAAPFQKKKKSGKLHAPPPPTRVIPIPIPNETVFVCAGKSIKEKLNDKEESPQKSSGDLISPQGQNETRAYVDKLNSILTPTQKTELHAIVCNEFKAGFIDMQCDMQKNYFAMADLCEEDSSLKPFLAVTLRTLQRMNDDFAALVKDNIKK